MKKIAGFIIHVKENFYGPFATAQEAVDWLNTKGSCYSGSHTIEFLYEPTREFYLSAKHPVKAA